MNKLSRWFVIGLQAIALLLLMTTIQAPKSVQAAVGFHISGRSLIDANGNNFIMRGINHAYAWYTGQNTSFANIKATGANTVRVVLGVGNRWGPTSASEVTTIINLCKTNKLICVLEDHDTTGYGEDSAATSLANAVNYWKSIQSVLTGQEAYVIINLGNEPYGNNNTANWVTDTKNAIASMRSAGFQHTLMVDGPNWGQDWSNTMLSNASSIFNSDPQRNVIFSIHMYGVYNTASKVQSYMSSFVNAGLPLLVGEFGNQHTDGDPDEDAIMSYAQSYGLGYLGWSWSGNGGSVAYLDMVTNFDPNQRTTWGNRIISGANGIASTSVQCSVYSGGPTSTPKPPTNTPNVPTNTPVSGSTLTDDLNDWSKSYSHSANLGFDTTNANLMAGDTSRANRSTKTQETIVWRLTNLTSAKFTTYFWPSEAVSHFSFATSSDGANWTSATPSISGGTSDWTQYVYTLSGLRNVNYIRVTWNNTAGNAWSPQIGQVILTGNTTNSTPVPTATRTNTPAPSNTPGGTSSLKVQYRAADTATGDNSMKPQFIIVNTGSSSVPLSELKIRYYFTKNVAGNLVFNCDYATIGCANLAGSFAAYSPVTSTADYYMEVSFTTSAGSIAANGNSGDIQTRVNEVNWNNFNESNDYSFDATKTSYADWTKVVLLRNGSVVWGIAP